MYKLLLVDDEEIIREGIARMIDWDALGIELTASCSNAIAALESMTDEMPDILLTDIRMPGMDGLELVQRAVALHPMLQTVILSGYDTFEYARQAVKCGVREYLLKPCSKEEMTEAIRRACHAVDKRRQHVLYLSGERSERVATLVGAFEALRMGKLGDEQLARQVRQIAKTAEDPSLLQEALISLIANNMGSGQTEWAMNIIMDAMRNREPLEHLIARSLMRLRGEGTTARGGDFVSQMTAYVEGHYADEALTLQYIADNVVYMNADYIGREFTRTVGRKFSSYLLEIRMERAKLLMASDPSLHSYQIAEQVGLGNNPHYFSQLFRKYTGMTPKDYRRRLQTGAQGE